MNMSKAFFESVKHVLAAYGRLLLLTLQKRCRERGGRNKTEVAGGAIPWGEKGKGRKGEGSPGIRRNWKRGLLGKKSCCYLLQSRDGRGHPRGTHHLHRFHKLLEGSPSASKVRSTDIQLSRIVRSKTKRNVLHSWFGRRYGIYAL